MLNELKFQLQFPTVQELLILGNFYIYISHRQKVIAKIVN
jgi:hypothetical protein